METRVCSKCGKRKPVNEFYKNSTKKGGYQTQCKQCYREYFSRKSLRTDIQKDDNSKVVFDVCGFDLHKIECEVIKKALRYYRDTSLYFIANQLGVTYRYFQKVIAEHGIDCEQEMNNVNNDIKPKDTLDDYEPRELLKSLYDRGYDGNFFIYVKQEMSLSKLFGEKQ